MITKLHEESDEEEIIEEVRRHPIVLWVPYFKIFLGFLVVVLIFLMFKASGIFSLVFFLWLIFGGIYGFYHYYIWRKDAYIITNSRIIIREQKSFFSKSVGEASLEDITDVTYKIKGFAPTLFNFGTIVVNTASADQLELVQVAKPHTVQKLILDLRDRCLEANRKEMTARELIDEIENRKKD